MNLCKFCVWDKGSFCLHRQAPDLFRPRPTGINIFACDLFTQDSTAPSDVTFHLGNSRMIKYNVKKRLTFKKKDIYER